MTEMGVVGGSVERYGRQRVEVWAVEDEVYVSEGGGVGGRWVGRWVVRAWRHRGSHRRSWTRAGS